MAATGVWFRPREQAELWVYVPQGGWGLPPCCVLQAREGVAARRQGSFEGGRHHVPPLPCSHLPGHPSPKTKGAAARPHGGFIVLCPGWGMRRGVTLHQASWMRAPRGGAGCGM